MKPIQHPLTLFLIGATGDLAKKKILKALYTLHTENLLPEVFSLVGNSRKELTNEQFREFVREAINAPEGQQWNTFAQKLFYVSGDVDESDTFDKLLKLHDQFKHCGNHLWYVATLPKLYIPAVRNIESSGFAHTTCGWTKIMLEKPFGTDVDSAHELDKMLMSVFAEDQIYRIDHFLAKETVQNLLIFRFANGIFEHLWSREYIDHIQILGSAEDLGVDGREAFYDQTGTIRDVVQNHVLQMMAMTMMEEPASLNPEDIRQRRHEVLQHLRPIRSDQEIKENVMFGQYTAGSIDGSEVKGYREENTISRDSRTETAVAMRCFVDTPRWKDVPIYIRSGKRLNRKVSEISIQFKEPPNRMFNQENCPQQGNVLTLRIQPNEGVVVRLRVKKPGLHLELEEVPMQFCYKNEFQMGLVESYVKLIYDAVQGDPTLFPRSDGIEISWQYVQPLLDYKAKPEFQPEPYVAGSWGPASFNELLEKDGRTWIEPSVDVCAI